MEIGIRNDEQLVKLAAVVQRSINTKGSDESTSFLTDEEKQELLRGIEEISKEQEEIKTDDDKNRSSENPTEWG